MKIFISLLACLQLTVSPLYAAGPDATKKKILTHLEREVENFRLGMASSANKLLRTTSSEQIKESFLKTLVKDSDKKFIEKNFHSLKEISFSDYQINYKNNLSTILHKNKPVLIVEMNHSKGTYTINGKTYDFQNYNSFEEAVSALEGVPFLKNTTSLWNKLKSNLLYDEAHAGTGALLLGALMAWFYYELFWAIPHDAKSMDICDNNRSIVIKGLSRLKEDCHSEALALDQNARLPEWSSTVAGKLLGVIPLSKESTPTCEDILGKTGFKMKFKSHVFMGLIDRTCIGEKTTKSLCATIEEIYFCVQEYKKVYDYRTGINSADRNSIKEVPIRQLRPNYPPGVSEQ